MRLVPEGTKQEWSLKGPDPQHLYRRGLKANIYTLCKLRSPPPKTFTELDSAPLQLDRTTVKAKMLFVVSGGNSAPKFTPQTTTTTRTTNKTTTTAPKPPPAPPASDGVVPMELDAVHVKHRDEFKAMLAEGKKAEMDRRREKGLCLYCGDQGHQATSCPYKRLSLGKA